MKKLCFFILLALVGAVSCVDDSENLRYENNWDYEDALATAENSISLKQAIGNAEFIYKDIEGGEYQKRSIKSVDLLTSSNFDNTSTRSFADNDPLVYVVNYEKGGYAVLSATEDLPPVIMLGDEGHFSTEQFLCYVNNDTLTRTGEEISPEKEMQYTLVNNSITGVVGPLYPIDQFTSVDTTMLLKCMPLVRTKWNQHAPYNKYAPVDEQGRTCLAGCVPVASAQTLASLGYHHNFRPTIDIDSDYPINWRMISAEIYEGKIKYNASDNTDGANEVAKLIRAIGKNIDANYGASATGGSPVKIAELYQALGMNNIQYLPKEEVTEDMLFDMIVNKNYPVECCAYRLGDDNSYHGHYFNIDGWLRLEYTCLTYHMTGGINQPAMPNPIQRQFDLVHVNFGWGGSSDGYYLPHAFDISDSEFDDYYESNDIVNNTDRNYNMYVHYMMYNL